MSFEEYEDFVYGATFCDHDDPAREWRKLSEMQQHKVDFLVGKKRMQLSGPNIELELSIKGRRFINSDGKRNMPSGEFLLGPSKIVLTDGRALPTRRLSAAGPSAASS